MKQTTLIRHKFFVDNLHAAHSHWHVTCLSGKFLTWRKRLVEMWALGGGLCYEKDIMFIPSITFILKHFGETTKIQANLLHAHTPFLQPIWGLFRQLQGTDKRTCKKRGERLKEAKQGLELNCVTLHHTKDYYISNFCRYGVFFTLCFYIQLSNHETGSYRLKSLKVKQRHTGCICRTIFNITFLWICTYHNPEQFLVISLPSFFLH